MVFIFDEGALERLGQIEGRDWVRAQEKNPISPFGFMAYLAAWQLRQESGYANDPDVPVRDFLELLPGGRSGDGAIYGEGGWSRYAVRHDGEIVLLDWSVEASARKREAAAQAGVRMASECVASASPRP